MGGSSSPARTPSESYDRMDSISSTFAVTDDVYLEDSTDDGTVTSDVYYQADIIRVNVKPDGQPFTKASSNHPYISANGRFVVYEVGYTISQVYLYDASDDSTTVISAHPDGTLGNGDSHYPAVSNDGDVAYQSYADNLTDQVPDYGTVIYYDHETGQNQLAQFPYTGDYADQQAQYPDVSSNGQFVSYTSDANNLVENDPNEYGDIFRYNHATGEIERVSIRKYNDDYASDISEPSAISGDGRFIAFITKMDMTGDIDGEYDDHQVFVRDMDTETNEHISIGHDGKPANDYHVNDVNISENGRFVVFKSAATNLVSSFDGGSDQIFLYDRETDQMELISQDANGVEANGDCQLPSVSADGRFVAFESEATNLVPSDNNGVSDIFVYDRETNTHTIVSVSAEGEQGNGGSSNPEITADGAFVVFTSAADNLVANDTNGWTDIFVSKVDQATEPVPEPDDISLNHNETISVTDNIQFGDAYQAETDIHLQESITIQDYFDMVDPIFVYESIYITDTVKWPLQIFLEDSISITDAHTSGRSSSGSGGSDSSGNDDDDSNPFTPGQPNIQQLAQSIPINQLSITNTFETEDGHVTVSIPGGTLNTPVTLYVKEVQEHEPPSPEGMFRIGTKTYQITLEDENGNERHQFTNNISIEFEYDADEIPPGSSEEDLQVFYWDDDLQHWIVLPSDQDVNDDTITAYVDHLTMFTVMAAPDLRLPIDIQDHWSQADILKMVSLKVVDSYPDQTFRPDRSVTRAEFIKMLVEVLEIDPSTYSDRLSFKDEIPEWARDYVRAGVQEGYIQGYSDGTFRANDLMTREQMAVILAKTFEASEGPDADRVFTDQSQISDWALDAVHQLVISEIISGFENNTFRPKDPVTRAQAVTVLSRLQNVLYR
ncbi:MAG: S-layer homology domain-containing protein [Bacillaceae bacterium]|nr:S-layer homology domain-containing protein [Bacillaceae bacterium]